MALGVSAALKVLGEIVRFVSQTAQVHDLADVLTRGCACDDRGRAAVAGGEVGVAERVDEIDHDVDTLEGSVDAGGVGYVRGDPANVGATLGVRPAGDRNHLVLACENRKECRSDRARRAEDGDSHGAIRSIRR